MNKKNKLYFKVGFNEDDIKELKKALGIEFINTGAVPDFVSENREFYIDIGWVNLGHYLRKAKK